MLECYDTNMPKKKKGVEPNKTIVELLESINMPIHDKAHGLFLYFKVKARSNETGVEHASKEYHGLQTSDIEMITKGINKPLLFKKDARHKHVLNYYLKRKHDKKNAIKVSVLIDANDPHRAEILTIFITSKIK